MRLAGAQRSISAHAGRKDRDLGATNRKNTLAGKYGLLRQLNDDDQRMLTRLSFIAFYTQSRSPQRDFHTSKVPVPM